MPDHVRMALSRVEWEQGPATKSRPFSMCVLAPCLASQVDQGFEIALLISYFTLESWWASKTMVEWQRHRRLQVGDNIEPWRLRTGGSECRQRGCIFGLVGSRINSSSSWVTSPKDWPSLPHKNEFLSLAFMLKRSPSPSETACSTTSGRSGWGRKQNWGPAANKITRAHTSMCSVNICHVKQITKKKEKKEKKDSSKERGWI